MLESRKNNVPLRDKLYKSSKKLKNLLAPSLANSYKKRIQSLPKPGDNYKKIGSITTTKDGSFMTNASTVVNLRGAQMKNTFIKHKVDPFRHMKMVNENGKIVHENGQHKDPPKDTRLYKSKYFHTNPMIKYVNGNKFIVQSAHQRLLNNIRSYHDGPIFAISTFSNPKIPLSQVFPLYKNKLGSSVTTNLYTRFYK